jgi:hypothetical protein
MRTVWRAAPLAPRLFDVHHGNRFVTVHQSVRGVFIHAGKASPWPTSWTIRGGGEEKVVKKEREGGKLDGDHRQAVEAHVLVLVLVDAC